MPKPKAPTLRLPRRANPYAKRIGKLMRLFRKAQGYKVSEAHRQLGTTLIHYRTLEAGAIMPGPVMAQRLWGWMVERKTYENAGPPREGYNTRIAQAPALTFKTLKVILDKGQAKDLRQRALLLGMAAQDLAAVYIQMGMAHKWAWATMQDAVKALQKARALQAFQEAPILRDLLTLEVDLLLKPAPLQAAKEAEAAAPLAPKLAQLTPDMLELNDLNEEVEVFE